MKRNKGLETQNYLISKDYNYLKFVTWMVQILKYILR